MFSLQYAALGYAQLDDLDTAIGLPSVPALATCVILTAEGQNIRWRDDGSNPTASVGMLLKTTDPAFFYSGSIRNIKFIEATAGAKLNIAYYK